LQQYLQIEGEMKQLEEIEIGNEVVYFRKGFLGWHIVYPIKINGKINWKNLISGGNWWNLAIVFFIVLVVLGCVYEYSIALKSLNECLSRNQIINIFPPLK